MCLLDPSGLTGLEPAASALTGRCSDQLNYNPREIRCIAIAHIFLWFNSTHFYLEGPSYIIRETRVIYWLYTWLYTRICTLVITSNLFVIDKSIDNPFFNEKSIFFLYSFPFLRLYTYRSWYESRSLARSEFVGTKQISKANTNKWG